MGGYGSGRWGWHHAKESTDPLLRLDVRHLARRGLIDPGVVGSLLVAWSRGDRPAGEVLVCYDDGRPGEVVLDYCVKQSEGAEWEPIRVPVALDRTPCPFGGSRPWFMCPGCLDRRAVLYGAGGSFRCRVCHGLAYGSTRVNKADRHRRRAGELRHRLGGVPGTFSLPRKPKGMHRWTYDRIVHEIAERELISTGVSLAEAETLLTPITRR